MCKVAKHRVCEAGKVVCARFKGCENYVNFSNPPAPLVSPKKWWKRQEKEVHRIHTVTLNKIIELPWERGCVANRVARQVRECDRSTPSPTQSPTEATAPTLPPTGFVGGKVLSYFHLPQQHLRQNRTVLAG